MILAYELQSGPIGIRAQGPPHGKRMSYHYTMCPSAKQGLGLPGRWQSIAAMEGEGWSTQCHTP
jgi:hypothetical protein